MLCHACLAIFRFPSKYPREYDERQIPHQASQKEVFEASRLGCRICKRLWKESLPYLLDKAQKPKVCQPTTPSNQWKTTLKRPGVNGRPIHLARNCCPVRRGTVLSLCGRTLLIQWNRFHIIYERRKVGLSTPTPVFCPLISGFVKEASKLVGCYIPWSINSNRLSVNVDPRQRVDKRLPRESFGMQSLFHGANILSNPTSRSGLIG
jgi:hypothetical protein